MVTHTRTCRRAFTAFCKPLNPIGGQSSLWSLHTERPHTIKTTVRRKGWEKLHTYTHIHHTSFNPRCLRESEGNGEAEHNSRTRTTRNGICVGLSAPLREGQGKRITTGWRINEGTKEKSSAQQSHPDSIGENKHNRQSKSLITNLQTNSGEG